MQLDENGKDTRTDDITLPAGMQKSQDLKDAKTAVEYHTQEANREFALGNKQAAREHKMKAKIAFESVNALTPSNEPVLPEFNF